MTYVSLLKKCEEELIPVSGEDASFEAIQLLSLSCGKTTSFIMMHSGDEAADDTVSGFTKLIQRRINGEPLQYIIGEWDFYKYTFFCGEGVLIPRPETEELVQLCIDFINKNHITNVLDLCAGTGCIGLSIALDCPFAQVTLVEKYDEAFSYLEKNISRYGLKNVKAVRDDVLSPSSDYGSYGLIVSNPPYIESREIAGLQQEVLREPVSALDGGEDGLIFYRAIRDRWYGILSSGGMLAFECGEKQTAAVAGLFCGCDTECLNDIYGNPRMVTAQKRG